MNVTLNFPGLLVANLICLGWE